MTGGMGRRNDLGTLAERAARAREPRPSRPDPAAPAPPVVRHCWVEGPGGRLPGLLLGWERRTTGWWGRVVHPVDEGRPGDPLWVVVEEWVSADRLTPLS